MKANPEIVMKFNLISLYSNNSTELSSLLLFNHITAFDHIQKDGYSLAPSLMLLETTNSKYSKFELSKNPCNRQWKRKYIDQIDERYQALKKVVDYNISPLSSEENENALTIELYNIYDHVRGLRPNHKKDAQKYFSAENIGIEKIEAVIEKLNEEKQSD